MSIRRREKKQKQKPLYDKKQPVHVVHFKLNERGGGAAGCHCELFISGGSRGYVCQATQLHVMAAFHFVFSMSKTSQGEWGTSFVAEIIFHFQMSFALMHRF